MLLLILSETQVPLWLEITSIAATIFFAGATAYYAWRQHKLDKTNLKLEAYDKRSKIYQEIKDYLSYITNKQEIKSNTTTEFKMKTTEAAFLFDDNDIEKFIEEIYEKGNHLQNLIFNVKATQDESKKQNLNNEIDKDYEWFSKQYQIAHKLFSKYLKLD